MAVLPLVVLAVVFGYAVFRYGGVVPEDWYLCLVGVGLAFTISRLTPRNGERVPGASAVTRLLILGILAVVLVQLVPLPASVVRLVSPARVELDEAVGEVVGAAPYTAMTIVPGETFRLLLTLVGLVLVFLLVREMAWRWRDNPWILAVPFVAVAFLEAVLGLVQYYWAGTPLATGTYVNRNHFSGLLEMALPFPLMGAVAVLRAGESVRSRRSPAGPAVRACLYLGVGAVLLLAIIHSLSRMGFIAALGSFFVMGATALGAGLSGWKRTVPVILVTSLVVAGFIFLPTDQLIERFATMAATDDITADTRAQIWRDTVELIRDFPVLGCGLGCYESGFYR
ncbi:MAG: O-antigen ligase family protein, partial [Phycisphaerae bacterium]|nr:O-antigen ligase family protein [Phycisphaerae bacterium]